MRNKLILFFLVGAFNLHATPFSTEIKSTIIVSLPATASVSKPMKNVKAEKLSEQQSTRKEKNELRKSQRELKNQKHFSENLTGESKDGKDSEVLGTIAAGLLLFAFIPSSIGVLFIASIPLAILAIVRGKKAQKKNPEDKKAKTGILLGTITLSVIATLFVLVMAALGSVGFF